jgi:hypothetical protein
MNFTDRIQYLQETYRYVSGYMRLKAINRVYKNEIKAYIV